MVERCLISITNVFFFSLSFRGSCWILDFSKFFLADLPSRHVRLCQGRRIRSSFSASTKENLQMRSKHLTNASNCHRCAAEPQSQLSREVKKPVGCVQCQSGRGQKPKQRSSLNLFPLIAFLTICHLPRILPAQPSEIHQRPPPLCDCHPSTICKNRHEPFMRSFVILCVF